MTITLVANFLVRRSSTQNWSNIEKNEILTFSVLLNSLLFNGLWEALSGNFAREINPKFFCFNYIDTQSKVFTLFFPWNQLRTNFLYSFEYAISDPDPRRVATIKGLYSRREKMILNCPITNFPNNPIFP